MTREPMTGTLIGPRRCYLGSESKIIVDA
jgi:hypothetical protein